MSGQRSMIQFYPERTDESQNQENGDSVTVAGAPLIFLQAPSSAIAKLMRLSYAVYIIANGIITPRP